jgi:hypothetical protein
MINSGDIKQKIKIALTVLFLMLGMFALFRFLLIVSYPSMFSELSFWDKAVSFLYGLRFDIATLCMFQGPFIILLFLPFGGGAK